MENNFVFVVVSYGRVVGATFSQELASKLQAETIQKGRLCDISAVPLMERSNSSQS